MVSLCINSNVESLSTELIKTAYGWGYSYVVQNYTSVTMTTEGNHQNNDDEEDKEEEEKSTAHSLL